MVTLTLTGCVVSGNCTISVDVIAIGVSVVVVVEVVVSVVVVGESVVDVVAVVCVVVVVTGAGSVIKAPTALQPPKLFWERAFTFQ
jgi:hypothetical protein